MRKLLPLLVLAWGCTNVASSKHVYEFQACTTGSCTRAANPLDGGEGLELSGVDAFRVTVCTPLGYTVADGGTMPRATLSGAGTVQMWTYDPDIDGQGDAGWGRNSALDWTPDNGANCSNRDFRSDAQLRNWRVAAVASSVTESIADAGVAGVWVNIDSKWDGVNP